MGREGVKAAPGGEACVKCVIVDREFPWWLQAARASGVMVYKIWLTNYTPELRTSVDAIVRDTPLEVGNLPSTHLMECLHQSDLVLVGGRLPEPLAEAGMWKLPGLQMVVTTSLARVTPPLPWQVEACTLRHSSMGGVTNGVHHLMVHTKSNQGWGAVKNWDIDVGAPQDLRWVLKSGIVGSPVPAPKSTESFEPSAIVRYLQTKVVHSSGLYPIAEVGTKVVTEFGGNRWVVRLPSTAELLLMMDVPEKLIKNLPPDESARLLQTMHVPGKVIQGLVKSAVATLRLKSRKQDRSKRVLGVTRDADRPTKKLKGQCLTVAQPSQMKENRRVVEPCRL
jgi:hypothetical protein